MGRLGGVLWASWVVLGSSWERFGLSWGLLGRFVGALERVGGVLGRPGIFIRRFGNVLEASWAVLGASWVDLGSSLELLGGYVSLCWGMVGHDGICFELQDEEMKIFRKRCEIQCFEMIFNVSEEPCWTKIGTCCGYFGAMLGLCWGYVGAMLEHLGATSYHESCFSKR